MATMYQREIERRVLKAMKDRDRKCVVYVSDFSGFDAGKEWEPEPIEKIFDYRDGDRYEDLHGVLDGFSRVEKEQGVTATTYYVC